jgi:hypothetical protein
MDQEIRISDAPVKFDAAARSRSLARLNGSALQAWRASGTADLGQSYKIAPKLESSEYLFGRNSDSLEFHTSPLINQRSNVKHGSVIVEIDWLQ